MKQKMMQEQQLDEQRDAHPAPAAAVDDVTVDANTDSGEPLLRHQSGMEDSSPKQDEDKQQQDKEQEEQQQQEEENEEEEKVEKEAEGVGEEDHVSERAQDEDTEAEQHVQDQQHSDEEDPGYDHVEEMQGEAPSSSSVSAPPHVEIGGQKAPPVNSTSEESKQEQILSKQSSFMTPSYDVSHLSMSVILFAFCLSISLVTLPISPSISLCCSLLLSTSRVPALTTPPKHCPSRRSSRQTRGD